ncbi:predicted protein [Streptomyces viridochromogenes DSM 40736]|uniref:Predicted protein n=1 Tax=Streptomyces viridochromogenes (strain DSM 40736 / JCM 4977 / BCRC 1201 / Tue 494) TaxID=591159 RepID=D9X156_STRVT|nr:hypothetical protein [Streptomyces viridochromogenes]EFL33494.1 predicted protein [Streptomyces viridochromogenes DSM 40736]
MVARLPGDHRRHASDGHEPRRDDPGPVLGGLSARHARDRSSALALIRTPAVTAWYELTPGSAPAPAAPSPAQGGPCATAEVTGLLEAAEFVAYCAYQHYARSHHRRFLWEWLPELLPDAARPLGI